MGAVVSTLYVDHAGFQVEKDGASLLVRDTEGTLRQRIPFGPLQRVILQGDIALHTGVLLALAKAGVEVICLGGRDSSLVVHCLGPRLGDARRRLAQYALAQHEERREALARAVLRAKLRAQVHALNMWLRDGVGEPGMLHRALSSWPSLVEAVATATQEEMLGLEGRAAALYFPAFFSTLPKAFQVPTRVKRPPTDPTNALLSLTYTLLHHEAIQVAHGQGLDPYIGALHRPSYGRESLACDLIEPLRSQADDWIRRLLHDAVLRPEHFYSDRDAVFLGKAGRAHFYRAWMQKIPNVRRRLRRLGRLAWHIVESECPN